MPLVYALVARGAVILADYSPYTGNFQDVCLECLQKTIGSTERRFSVHCDDHVFHILQEGNYRYLVVSGVDFRQISFAFLEIIRKEFEGKHGDAADTAVQFALNNTFQRRMEVHLNFVMDHPNEALASVSKTAAVNKKISDVKAVMTDNLVKVFERGEKLDVLNDKAKVLEEQANMFKSKVNVLRNQMWWKQIRIKIIIVFLVLLLLGGGGFAIFGPYLI